MTSGGTARRVIAARDAGGAGVGQGGPEPAGALHAAGREPPVADRHRVVRVGGDEAMSRKVLADAGHSAVAQAAHQRGRKLYRRVRIAMERASADDGAAAMIEIEHRREAEIDAVTGQ